MSKRDLGVFREDRVLRNHGSGYVAVFDYSAPVSRLVEGSTKKRLRDDFSRLSVRAPETLVVFELAEIPPGTVGPIPQRNASWVKEYRFPEGTPVERIVGEIRL